MMLRSALAVLISCGWGVCFTQNIKPCPAPLSETPFAKKWCLEALPRSGFLVLSDSTGDPCACRCLDQIDRPWKKHLELLEERTERYSSNRTTYAQRLHARGLTRNSPSGQPVVARRNAHCNMRMDDYSGLSCPSFCDLRMMIEHISHLRLWNDDPVEIVYELRNPATSTTERLPVPEAHRNDVAGEPDIVYIKLPYQFLHSPHSGRELVLFFLLHEVAHEVLENENEHDADMWAVHVGLPAYFANDDSWCSRAFLDRMLVQFRQYSIAEYGANDYRKSNGCGARLGCYPEFNCREKGILGIQTMGELDRGYPSEVCWDNTLDSKYDFPETTTKYNSCPDLKEVPLRCEWRPALDPCPHVMNRGCSVVPKFCEINWDPWLGGAGKGPDARKRRWALEKLERQLSRMDRIDGRP